MEKKGEEHGDKKMILEGLFCIRVFRSLGSGIEAQQLHTAMVVEMLRYTLKQS